MAQETSLAAFAQSVGDVTSVALGGMLLENRPSALVRALIRSGRGGLFVTSAPAGSWDIDVLIAAGLVKTVRVPHVSFAVAGTAPATKAAKENGSVAFDPVDEALLLGGYLAASAEADIQLLDNLGVSDFASENPLLIKVGDHQGVGPLRVDLALLHAQYGDAEGNLVHVGSRWADLLIARAAKRVVAQVDKIVPARVTAKLGVTVPGYLVDEIVETPLGAHPTGSVGAYVADLAHLAEYQAAVKAGSFSSYADRYITPDHDAYVAELGTARHAALSAEAQS
ncbi:CoA-transferase [Dactylosporangium sp. NPDC051485]|uniref:CoA transferase subunit A n=1 Tax=Dactylosporangium sp. NPDC051485 TaxID=3154846 RepID=UPI00341335A7